MKDPYNDGKNNVIIANYFGYKEVYNGDDICSVEMNLFIDVDRWMVRAQYYLMDNEKGSIPLMDVDILKVPDPLLPFKLAGGYEVKELDKEKYLRELEEYLLNEDMPNFVLPIMDFVRFRESLPRKMFRDNINDYIAFLASNDKDHYLTDYWKDRWADQVCKLTGCICIHNDTLLDKGIVKKKGVMKSWRK